MKIAIVCDWLITVGGAEKFLGHLLQCFPNADVYAVVDFLPDRARQFLCDKKTYTTFIQKFPFAKKYYRYYLPFMPIAVEQLDLSNYDLILSSSHAVAKGVITSPDQLHISYVHSPMRYIWDLQHQYLRETGLSHQPYGWIIRYLLHKLRNWDVRSSHHVDYFLANSKFIARRIHKIYRRDAEVIYPPIELAKFSLAIEKEDFFVTASRFVPYKKIDLIVESFAEMPDKKLIVMGDGPEFTKIKAKAKSNITLLGFVSNEILISYLQRAKAFIFAAEEDFGLLPVEAQACGTPVIAFGKGGALETVCDLNNSKPTGIFFDSQTKSSLQSAINLFETNQDLLDPNHCRENALRFSPENFAYQLTQFISEKWQAFLQHKT